MNSQEERERSASPGFSPGDTIAAISTPPGPGAIGMVRISGPDARLVGEKVFSPASPRKSPFPPREAIFGRAHEPGRPGEPIDFAVLTFYEAPRTYTGEDIVEVTLHGGTLIVGTFLGAALKAGARLAEPGEFTKRAFLNGRMDLSQAEAVAGLILAATEEARKVMLRQVEGVMGREAAFMRERLMEAKVLLEASIDFPEEAGEGEGERVEALLDEVLGETERLLGTSRAGIALREGFRVVIIGAPNVGKSSLLNTFLEEERAIVHELAGTTRDFIEGSICVRGIPMRVVDTAGIRVSGDALEREGVRRTRSLMERADVLLVVLDGSRPLFPEEETLLEETRGLVRVVAANKSDLGAHPGFDPPQDAVWISALRKEGIEELKGAVQEAFLGNAAGLDTERGVATTVRQSEALKRVRDGCARAGEASRETGWEELAAVGVDEALAALGELTGEVTSEEILGGIFSRFCVGK